ncbi:MAG: extracellular solute-binding protein, partial [Bauldia sp.]|nr:extracellular solute-binding protein [Bauldia sp.]
MKALSAAGFALGTALSLFAGAAVAAPVTISFLTHWSPETVARLEAAVAEYKKTNPDVTVEVRAVPFGDLLTTLRSQGGSSGGATIAGIY